MHFLIKSLVSRIRGTHITDSILNLLIYITDRQYLVGFFTIKNRFFYFVLIKKEPWLHFLNIDINVKAEEAADKNKNKAKVKNNSNTNKKLSKVNKISFRKRRTHKYFVKCN